MRGKLLPAIAISGFVSLVRLDAQEKPDSQTLMLQILQRLDSLERENKQLIEEVHALKQDLTSSRQTAAPAAPGEQSSVEERVTVDENRINEQAQTKVEASQKFPISLNGMLLFNAFANTGESGAPGTYGLLSGPASAGATVRQTLIGLQFQGPSLPRGGQVHGSFMMDFGGGYSEPGTSWLRFRQGTLSLDWPNRSFSVGQDKPLISPYQPDSFAEVIIPPLAGAGNLWLWLPQARYEERLHFGTSTGLTGQVAVIETNEDYQTVPDEYANSLGLARPGLEGRLAFWHKFDDQRRFEFAPGFHVSSTHVAGASVASRIASLDWKVIPWSHLQFSGTVYRGENVASLGALSNGFSIFPNGSVRPVHSSGGWTQLAFPVTSRLTFNLFSGIESDRASDLIAAYATRDWTYASNVMYHLGPNVIVSAEALQTRLRLLSGGGEIRNHYDLALGYLF